MGDTSKLPKWAQQRIEVLEANLASTKRDLERMTEAAGFREGRYGELYAPGGERVVFGAGPDIRGEGIEVKLHASTRQVVVSAVGYSLVVLPQASNMVRLEVRR